MKDWEKNVTMRVKIWIKHRKKSKTLSAFEREALDWVNKNQVQSYSDNALHPSDELYIKTIFKKEKK